MNSAELWRDGVASYNAGDLDAAEAALRSSLRQKPDDPHAQFALGFTLLAAGRYAEGWPLLEARKILRPDNCKAPMSGIPEWTGQPLTGKRLFVMTEQGLGDQIMMARFVPELRARGARVMLAARPPIAPLLAPLADDVLSLAEGQGARIPLPDFWTHYFSLPRYLGVTLADLPAAPYLRAPTDCRAPDGYAERVGFVWRTRDPARNLPDDLAQRLLARGLVSLHPEDSGAKNFADTAAIIERLSLVVTIDTAVAHLAGAMGKPVWVLLPHHGVDWRWMRERSDSPWYPTARLFRQPPEGGWSSVIDEVNAELDALG